MVDGVIAAQEHKLERGVEGSSLMSADPASVIARPFDWLFQAMQKLGPMSELIQGLLAALAGPPLERGYVMEYLMAYTYSQQSHRNLVLRAQAMVATAQIQPYLARLMNVVLRSQESGVERRAPADVDRKVTRLLRSSPSIWRRAIVAPYGLRQLEQAVDWDELEREWALRNLLVHKGGVIDRAYQARHLNDQPIGAVIDLSREDIERLFDLAVSVRFAFGLACTERVDPGRGVAAASEHYVCYWPQFAAGHFRAALGIARAALAFATNPEEAAVARVNMWLARDRLGEQESVGSEVAAWDVADLPRHFHLARLVLLHDDDRAIALLKELVDEGTVTPDDARTLPLFARLREAGVIS